MTQRRALLGVVAIGALTLFTLWSRRNQETTASAAVFQESVKAGENKFPPRTDNQGSVTVTVEPIDLSSASATWKFRVTLDTHSGQLSEDMQEAAFLINSLGKEYRSLSWEGDPPGGHHRQGDLTFSADVAPVQGALMIEIRNVGGVERRRFCWGTDCDQFERG